MLATLFPVVCDGVRKMRGRRLWSRVALIANFVSAIVIDAADPECSRGIRNAHSLACCAASCGACGGTNCQDRPGGSASCCTGSIVDSNRSCDDNDPPCTVTPSPSKEVRVKRGYVADGESCDDALLLNASAWFYGYNVENPYRQPGIAGNCSAANASANLDARFAPMNWCLSSIPKPIPEYVNRTFFMGFNEPNNLHNCNTDAHTAAVAWASVMQKWGGSVLVSPATAGNGTQWFDEFFGNCSHLYGPGGCNVTYLAAHCYSCTTNKTLGYLRELYDRYGKKIWLTEFSCGDHEDQRPTADHISYMLEVLPLLDATDFVSLCLVAMDAIAVVISIRFHLCPCLNLHAHWPCC